MDNSIENSEKFSETFARKRLEQSPLHNLLPTATEPLVIEKPIVPIDEIEY